MSTSPLNHYSHIVDVTPHWGFNELFNKPTLCAKLITAMNTYGKICCFTWEGRSATDNGFYALLDELCEYYKWNKSDIHIETGNPIEYHPEYPVSLTLTRMWNMFDIKKIVPTTWNQKKVYGMFIGRASANRMYCYYRNNRFNYKHLGITSFNHNISNILTDYDALQYLQYTNSTPAEMYSELTPYSDISTTLSHHIGYPDNMIGWEKVYQDIAIEVVCETSTSANCADVSEKILRPILHKRPFLLVSSPNMLTFLQSMGFRTFDNVIPSWYDHMSDNFRIDAVFDILDNLISTGKINTLLNDCQSDIDHNYAVLTELYNKWYTRIEFNQNCAQLMQFVYNNIIASLAQWQSKRL